MPTGINIAGARVKPGLNLLLSGMPVLTMIPITIATSRGSTRGLFVRTFALYPTAPIKTANISPADTCFSLSESLLFTVILVSIQYLAMV